MMVLAAEHRGDRVGEQICISAYNKSYSTEHEARVRTCTAWVPNPSGDVVLCKLGSVVNINEEEGPTRQQKTKRNDSSLNYVKLEGQLFLFCEAFMFHLNK